MSQTFLFYDLETSGKSPSEDRIMQFAAQRTNLDLEPLGDPINLTVRLSDDTLPSPEATAITGITPQFTQENGISEAEFCQKITTEIFTPDTIAVGFNNIHFDDEMLRYTLWRNFHDPYEWQWKDGRSRWDILDVARMTRALRPKGIEWPFDADGNPVNRLTAITTANQIEHTHAHDALADVFATIAVAKLLKTAQPQLFQYLFTLRDKNAVKKLVNLDHKRPFVYTSGRYGKEHNFTTVAFPLSAVKNGNILVFDLRHNIDEILKDKERFDALGERPDSTVKTLAPNRCPAVAPLSVLEKDDGWQKIGLESAQVEKNLQALLDHPEVAEQLRTRAEQPYEEPEPANPAELAYREFNVEKQLYQSFIPDADRPLCRQIQQADADTLADLHPNFTDERLAPLLLRYKAKNFPSSLSESEQKDWETYRRARLTHQAPRFIAELQAQAEQGMDDFLLEELKLWFESLQSPDY